MASSRASDIKLLVGGTVAVLLFGSLVGAFIWFGTGRGAKAPVCGEYNVGSAANTRKILQNGGPYFSTGGADCSFYLAIDASGNIVAYKAIQPDGCTLQLKRDHWECGGTRVADTDLAKYPVRIQSVGQVDAVIVDLRAPPAGATSTTRA